MGTAKGYMFRVFSHSATSFTPSDEFKYPMPPNIKKRAITAGLIGIVVVSIQNDEKLVLKDLRCNFNRLPVYKVASPILKGKSFA